MCTVTYSPTEAGIIITHNRDEKLTRLPSELPQLHNVSGKKLIFPRDKDKNGTWFCCDENGRTACILNGGLVKHNSNPPYRKSRGIVVLDTFTSNSFQEWLNDYDLDNIEPFTLILFENKSLFELKWDGIKKHIKELNPSNQYIWNSTTLYSTEAAEKREKWLKDWLKNNPNSPHSLFQFHNYGGDGDESTNLKMEIRGSHETVSITQFVSENNKNQMNHHNFSIDKKISLEF